MRKLSILLVAAILFGNIHVGNMSAVKYSDKTYLSVRPQSVNLPIQQTTWHTSLSQEANGKYNGTLQITPFYQSSENDTDLGKYFGFDWEGTRGKENIISVAYDDATKVYASRQIIHSITPTNYDLAADYYMNPKQDVFGARFDYHQDLDKILDGLYVRISTPIVEVKNRIGITQIGTENTSALDGIAKEYTFLDYLSGKVENVIDANNLQDKLKYAKMDGNSHNSSGLADIDLRLGWKMMANRRNHFGMSIDLLIPTGKTPKGEWLFESVQGNGHHWAVGGSMDGSFTIWRKDRNCLKMTIVGDYKYLFQGIEKRTLDFFDPNSNLSPQSAVRGGHYILGGENGVAKVLPLANVLTQDMRVKPGSQFDGIANLSFHNKNWVFDLGYNFFYKEKENVSLRNPWINDKYAMAGIAYDTATAFDTIYYAANTHATVVDATGLTSGTSNVAIQENDLDFNSVRTPSTTTHKIYGGIGYHFNKYKHPTMLGIGGSYEFADNNAALEGWALWAKGAIRF